MRRKAKGILWLTVFMLMLFLCGCQAKAETGEPAREAGEGETETLKMKVQVGDAVFTAALEENDSVKELVEMMQKEPVTIQMEDYAGFEKFGPLGKTLTSDDYRTTTAPGDIVLYTSNQIVIFYGTNTWEYTRIGRIEDLTGWEEALGKGEITVVFSLQE